MYVLFVILIAVGLALGIYGVVVQRGALVVKLDRKMTFISIIWGALSLAAACAGYGIGKWILSGDIAGHSIFWAHVLAGVLLAAIGIRMLIRAFKKHSVFEHRMENIDIKHDTILSLQLCGNALLAGVACGLLEYSLLLVILAFFLAAVLFAVGGYVSGRSLGIAPSSKAYAIGGGLLCLLSILLQL
ncbi:MAG TPA: manganese efflux pump [Lachnospiraceae bacterium]|nr:manganese efflux pump [Lachnospiraceae bacterium]